MLADAIVDYVAEILENTGCTVDRSRLIVPDRAWISVQYRTSMRLQNFTVVIGEDSVIFPGLCGERLEICYSDPDFRKKLARGVTSY